MPIKLDASAKEQPLLTETADPVVENSNSNSQEVVIRTKELTRSRLNDSLESCSDNEREPITKLMDHNELA